MQVAGPAADRLPPVYRHGGTYGGHHSSSLIGSWLIISCCWYCGAVVHLHMRGSEVRDAIPRTCKASTDRHMKDDKMDWSESGLIMSGTARTRL